MEQSWHYYLHCQSIKQCMWIHAARDEIYPRTHWNLIEICVTKKYHIFEALNKNDGTKVVKFRKFSIKYELDKVCDKDINEYLVSVKLPKEIKVHRKALKELGDGIIGLQHTILEDEKSYYALIT